MGPLKYRQQITDQQVEVTGLKGVNIPIRLLSWAFPVVGEAIGEAWCGTR